MNIIKEKTGEGYLLKVKASSLLKDEAAELKEVAQELIQQGVKDLSVDLSNTQYIDSSGIGKILFLNKKLSAVGGVFSIHAISGKLYEFFDSLAITKVMEIKTILK